MGDRERNETEKERKIEPVSYKYDPNGTVFVIAFIRLLVLLRTRWRLWYGYILPCVTPLLKYSESVWVWECDSEGGTYGDSTRGFFVLVGASPSLSPDLSGAALQYQMGARERPPEERGPPVIEGALLHWAREKTFGLIVIKEIFWRTACRRVYGVDRARLYMHSCAVCEREI